MDYDYVRLPQRQPLKWPGGARVALILTFNLETWDLTKPTAKSLPGVWWATREEIAAWYLENHESHIPNQLGDSQLKAAQ